MASAAEFALFPELPTEIRLPIAMEGGCTGRVRRPYPAARPGPQSHRHYQGASATLPPRVSCLPWSRSVAGSLFPVRLSVYHFTNWSWCWLDLFQYENSPDPIPHGRVSYDPSVGEIPVNMEHDYFLFALNWGHLRRYQLQPGSAKILGGQPLITLTSEGLAFTLDRGYPVGLPYHSRGPFVGSYITGEIPSPLIRAIRNPIAVVYGKPPGERADHPRHRLGALVHKAAGISTAPPGRRERLARSGRPVVA
ncbi:hypothetical protein PG993_011078 [Apiospora rasikravindrae]|uniref:Uncharacterized protein n=1 Tax=Apiospora rasikravindrae TaxID=990691 RepID=A0ABR1SFF4_9PEZI